MAFPPATRYGISLGNITRQTNAWRPRNQLIDATRANWKIGFMVVPLRYTICITI